MRHNNKKRKGVFAIALACAFVGMLLAAGTASAATKGFDIYNLTGATLRLDRVEASGKQPVFEEPSSSAPAPPQKGDLLKPGEAMHIELYDKWSVLQYENRREVVLDFSQFPPPNSASGRRYAVGLATGDDSAAYLPSQVVMWCEAWPMGTANQCPADGTMDPATAKMMDPPGTKINIPASDAPAQAAVLEEVCRKDSGATCTFNPTKRESTTHPLEPISDPVINCSPTSEDEVTEKYEHKVGTTTSVEVGHETSAEFNVVVAKVKTAISFKYGHEWIDEHTYGKEIRSKVEPLHKVWIEHATPVIRFTGDFTLKIGNTTFNLTGVYFDQPDPGRKGAFYKKSVSATPAELENCKHHEGLMRLPKSALTVARSGSASSNTIIGGPGSEVLRGLGGNDILNAGGGNDTLIGGPGNDVLVGRSGLLGQIPQPQLTPVG